MFAGTSNHVAAIALVMMDLKRLSPNLVDEVVIFHDGIRRRDRRRVQRILPTKFVRYRLKVKDRRNFHFSTLEYFSEMVFAKYEVFRLLDDYENVLFTDYDVVVTQDVSELLLPCASGIKMLQSEDQSVRDNLHSPVEEFKMDTKGHTAAFIAVHDNLRNYREIYEWCYQKTEQYANQLYLPEQAILNFAIEKFSLKPLHLDPRVYCLHPKDVSAHPEAKILHAYGAEKFWSGVENAQWNENYSRWKNLGGVPIQPRRVKWSFDRVLSESKELIKKHVLRR